MCITSKGIATGTNCERRQWQCRTRKRPPCSEFTIYASCHPILHGSLLTTNTGILLSSSNTILGYQPRHRAVRSFGDRQSLRITQNILHSRSALSRLTAYQDVLTSVAATADPSTQQTQDCTPVAIQRPWLNCEVPVPSQPTCPRNVNTF